MSDASDGSDWSGLRSLLELEVELEARAGELAG
jgi:hypothetical protein